MIGLDTLLNRQVLEDFLLQWEQRDDSAEAVPLTPEEALDFLGLLPTFDSMQAAPLVALEPLNAWAVANPALSERWPAHGLLRSLRIWAEDIGALSEPTPFAGTYRFVVTDNTGDSMVFYSCTAEWPTSTLRAMRQEDVFEPGQAIVGYYFSSRWAANLRGLPTGTTTPAGD